MKEEHGTVLEFAMFSLVSNLIAGVAAAAEQQVLDINSSFHFALPLR